MRINTNIAAIQAYGHVDRTNRATSASMARLSSGARITRAADDASGLNTANSLRAELRGLKVASGNIEQASGMLKVAEGAVASIQDILERMRELTVTAASANSQGEINAIFAEHDTLLQEIDRLVDGTNYRGQKLLDGSFTSLTFQIGAGSNPQDRITLTLAALDTGTLALGPIPSFAGAAAHLDDLDAALDMVSSVMETIGASQNRLDFAQTTVRTSILTLSATHSTIRDVDVATEFTAFSRQQVLQQAGSFMLGYANNSTQGVLQLFA